MPRGLGRGDRGAEARVCAAPSSGLGRGAARSRLGWLLETRSRFLGELIDGCSGCSRGEMQTDGGRRSWGSGGRGRRMQRTVLDDTIQMRNVRVQKRLKKIGIIIQ